MKYGVIFTTILGLIAIAYVNANQKLNQKIDLKALHLQMSVTELESTFGSPFSRQRNSLIYILEDDNL